MSNNSERHQFISVAGLPGRLTAQEAAWVLGFSDHDIPVLVTHRLLRPLGDPPPNGGRYYALPDLEVLRKDAKWLHKASAVLVKHWRIKNADRRTDRPAGCLNRLRKSNNKKSDQTNSNP
ncbi:MAG TPA: hypothetical protein VL981_11195 [Candidatus Methylacidiphilales bacterium]|nr:hypothetical protein [Candidatus Methylacidiphilales bacterium]